MANTATATEAVFESFMASVAVSSAVAILSGCQAAHFWREQREGSFLIVLSVPAHIRMDAALPGTNGPMVSAQISMCREGYTHSVVACCIGQLVRPARRAVSEDIQDM